MVGRPNGSSALKTKWLRHLAIGISRHPLRIPFSAFLSYSVLWTILESASFLIADLKPRGWLTFSTMVAVSIIIGICRVLPKRSVTIWIKSIDTRINARFGDLFSQEGMKVIPVNEYFDSELGDHVSPRSIHGQLIAQYFSGHPASFDALVDSDLTSTTVEHVDRTTGRQNRYSIGTTAMISTGGDRFLLLALCLTDLTTLKASCDVPQLWNALSGLWPAVRNRAGGAPISIPLIGGGLSGIGLPPSLLAQLIILSIVNANRANHIGSAITLVLPYDRFDEIELDILLDHWR